MSRGDLERLNKNELIELVLKLQRLAKTSRKGEAAVRTVVATACMTSSAGTFSTVLGTISA